MGQIITTRFYLVKRLNNTKLEKLVKCARPHRAKALLDIIYEYFSPIVRMNRFLMWILNGWHGHRIPRTAIGVMSILLIAYKMTSIAAAFI
jgi:hypothetical protein